MKQLGLFLKITQSNRAYIPFLMLVMLLNSTFNLLSLVSVFPIVEYVVYGAGSGTQSEGASVLGGSRVSNLIETFLNTLGLSASLASISVLIAGIFLAKAALAVLTTYCTHSFAERVRCFWVDVVCSRYFYASYRPVAQHNTGIIANNIIREPTQVGRFVRAYLAYLNSIFLSAAIIFGMLYVEWRIVSVFFGCLLLLYPILKYTLFEKSEAYGRRSIALSQAIIGLTAEKSSNIKQVHILGIQEYSRDRIMKVMRGLSRVLIGTQTIKEMPRNVVELFVVSIGLGMLLVLEATYDGGLRSILPSLIFFGVALSRLSGMFASLVSLHVACVNRAPSISLLLDFAKDERFDSEVEPKDGAVPFTGVASDIELDRVSFAYDSQHQVLNELSCTIPHGRLTCFIGPSGSGKSTLMDLLMRLYDPDSGRICCNGHNINEFRLADWRNTIGYISQDASTFSVSLRENVTLGRQDVTDEKLDEVASILHLDRLVQSLERGWDTEVGQDGLALSGGERKRVAIARALLREPDLLIFDEATVSFQEGLEQDMLSQIRSVWPSVSIVIITHRLSTIENADLVHVLDHGRIIASGDASEVRGIAQSLLAKLQDQPSETPEAGIDIDLDLEVS